MHPRCPRGTCRRLQKHAHLGGGFDPQRTCSAALPNILISGPVAMGALCGRVVCAGGVDLTWTARVGFTRSGQVTASALGINPINSELYQGLSQNACSVNPQTS